MPIDATIVRTMLELGVALPESTTDPVEQRRRAYDFEKAIFPSIGIPGPLIPVHEHLVAVEGYPDVLVRLYYPREPEAGGELPVCLFFYGGGFIQGGLHHPSTDAQCARRAVEANVVVAAVSYALAPEHPFPTALEQGCAALEWLAGAATELGVDAERIGVWGQSSGGNLAAVLALLDRDRARRLRCQILEVPVLDLTDDPAERDMSEISADEQQYMKTLLRWYIPDGVSRRDPRLSPIRAEDLSGLPDTYLITAGCDALRHDGARYASLLAEAGVGVSAIELVGLPHNGALFERVSLTARSAGAVGIAALRTLHN